MVEDGAELSVNDEANAASEYIVMTQILVDGFVLPLLLLVLFKPSCGVLLRQSCR